MGAEVVLSRTQIFLAKEVRLWDNVVMANTTEHISIRLPVDLVARINLDMLAESRSRSKVIELRLRSVYGTDRVHEHDAGGLHGAETMKHEWETKASIVAGIEKRAALREICAGTIPANVGTIEPPPLQHWPACLECDSPMREVKGKWACSDASCAMYGKEQKGKP